MIFGMDLHAPTWWLRKHQGPKIGLSITTTVHPRALLLCLLLLSERHALLQCCRREALGDICSLLGQHRHRTPS